MKKQKINSKIKYRKRLLTVLTVFVLLFVLAIPCFAWEQVPITPTGAYQFTYGFYFTLNDNPSVIVACAYGNDTNVENYLVLLDTEYVDLIDYEFIQRECTYYPLTLNIPSEQFAQDVIIIYQMSSSETINDSIQSIYNTAYDSGYNSGYEVGYDKGFSNVTDKAAYDKGYNDGLNESNIARNTILTLFSAPTYILSTVFGFEIFGINIYTLICFVLTISIVAVIIKRIL